MYKSEGLHNTYLLFEGHFFLLISSVFVRSAFKLLSFCKYLLASLLHVYLLFSFRPAYSFRFLSPFRLFFEVA